MHVNTNMHAFTAWGVITQILGNEKAGQWGANWKLGLWVSKCVKVLIIRRSNCIIQRLVLSHSVGGRLVHRLRESPLSTASGIITLCRWLSGAQVERESTHNLCTRRPPTVCDDTRCCIIQFGLLMMGKTVLKTCRGI